MADLSMDFYNSDGVLAVSGTMMGFFCRKTGTGQSRSRIGGNTNPSSILVETSGYTSPIVAITLPDGNAAAFAGSYNLDGAVGVNFASSAPVGTNFSYYVFEWSKALPANNGLVQLFLQNGDCAFSSAYWPMKMVYAIGNAEGSEGGKYSNGSKTLAFAIGAIGGHSRCEAPYCERGGGPQIDDENSLESCDNIRGQIDGKLYGAKLSDNGHTVTGARVSWDDVNASFGNYANYQQYGDGWTVANTVSVIDVTNIPVGQTFF